MRATVQGRTGNKQETFPFAGRSPPTVWGGAAFSQLLSGGTPGSPQSTGWARAEGWWQKRLRQSFSTRAELRVDLWLSRPLRAAPALLSLPAPLVISDA